MSDSANAYRTVVVGTGAAEAAKMRTAAVQGADVTRRSACDVLVVHTTG